MPPIRTTRPSIIPIRQPNRPIRPLIRLIKPPIRTIIPSIIPIRPPIRPIRQLIRLIRPPISSNYELTLLID